jgi:hypothetical protein
MIQLNRERKILLIGGLLVIFAGAIYRFSPSLPSFITNSDEMSSREKELKKYRIALEEKQQLEAILVSAERELARNEAGLLSQKTPALAAVEIQNMINDIAEQRKIPVQSIRHLKSKPKEKGDYMTVPVEVKMTATTRQMVGAFFSIENSRRLLRITSIRIRSPNMRDKEKLSCTFTVEGLMKSEKDA